MTREQAEKHYAEHVYPFALSSPDMDEDVGGQYVSCTTKVASEFAEAIAALGSTIDIEATHPEFLGWTVEEIMENSDDGE